jgi:chitinase
MAAFGFDGLDIDWVLPAISIKYLILSRNIQASLPTVVMLEIQPIL